MIQIILILLLFYLVNRFTLKKITEFIKQKITIIVKKTNKTYKIN
jgi:hypothetical protein